MSKKLLEIAVSFLVGALAPDTFVHYYQAF